MLELPVGGMVTQQSRPWLLKQSTVDVQLTSDESESEVKLCFEPVLSRGDLGAANPGGWRHRLSINSSVRCRAAADLHGSVRLLAVGAVTGSEFSKNVWAI